MKIGRGWWRPAGWIAAWLGTTVLGGALSCSVVDAFACSSDGQCGDRGQCEVDGFCSFPDPDCESGRRYGQYAGPELSEECVGLPGTTQVEDVEVDSSSSSASLPPEGSRGPALDDGTTAAVGGGDTGPVTQSTGEESSTGPIAASSETTAEDVERVTEGLLVLYLFDEGMGDTVADHSGVDPLDLLIDGTGATWTGLGLQLDGDVIVRAPGSASKIRLGVEATDEITVEAWVTPLEAGQEGPARIVNFSDDQSFRNFTLGQGLYLDPQPVFVGRIRTDDPDTDSLNGLPQLETGAVATTRATHLAYMRSSSDGVDRLYVNGMLEAEGPRVGSLSNWSETAQFALGNEFVYPRPWRGELHLVAVYDRALTTNEIAQNIEAGH